MTTNTNTSYIEIYAPSDDSDPDPIFEGECATDDIAAAVAQVMNLNTTMHGVPVLDAFEDRFLARRVSDNRIIAVVYITAL